MTVTLRLSDTIYTAIDLALNQGDWQAAELLIPALEYSLTRKVGGGEFVERRSYPKEFLGIFDRLEALKRSDSLLEA